jgi:hypothetical protein
MSEILNTDPTVQPAAANLAQWSDDAGEVISPLAGLPIEVVGQQDPLNPDSSTGFPNLLYHGTKAEDFTLDDNVNHRSASVGTGARTGAGLYAASKGLSQTFGTGTVVELIPHNANLIDLDSPQAKEPLSENFKKAYLKDAYAQAPARVQEQFPDVDPKVLTAIWNKCNTTEGLVTKDVVWDIATKARDAGKIDEFGNGRRVANEIASQVNTARLMESLTGVSIQELFATYDSVSGETRVPGDVVFNIAPTIDFLTSQGVDGAKTVQRFNGPDGKEQGVVLWKLDNVGDKATWERRLKKTPADLGDIAIEGADVQLDKTAGTVSDTKAEVREFLTRNNIDMKTANAKFENVAQQFIRGLHENASAEGRALTLQETMHIKNVVEIVSEQRKRVASR